MDVLRKKEKEKKQTLHCLFALFHFRRLFRPCSLTPRLMISLSLCQNMFASLMFVVPTASDAGRRRRRAISLFCSLFLFVKCLLFRRWDVEMQECRTKRESSPLATKCLINDGYARG